MLGRLATVVGLVLVVVGCASVAGVDRNTVIGAWVFGIDTGDCGYVLNLEGDGSWRSADLCVETAEELVAEVREGSYEDLGDAISVTVTRSTCPGEPSRTERYDYQLVDGGEALRLEIPTGIVLLTRFEEGDLGDPVSARITNGCFAEDGTFTEAPLVDL